jgi:hypothetical protein
MPIADGRKSRLPEYDKRFSVAVPHATHFVDEAVEILFFYRVLYRLKDFERASGSTAGSSADQNHWRLVIPYLPPAGLRLFFYFLEFQFFSFFSCSFWS